MERSAAASRRREPARVRAVGPEADAPPKPRSGAGRNLPVAIASGVALAAVFIGSLFVHPYAFLTFFELLVVVALLELAAALRVHGLRPATPVAVGVSIVLVYGAYAAGPAAQSLGLVLLVFGTMAWTLVDPGSRRWGSGREHVAASLGATFLMTLWVPFLVSYAGLLLARGDVGRWHLLAVVALAVTNDIGAFAFGNFFGRHKLAPSVSPAKTWEGFVGGIATVLVLAAAVTARLPGFDLRTALVVAFGVAVAGTVGDLAESMVKRDLGIKDLGRIVPGHGGIMDRADAIIFAIPTAYLLLEILGR
jgi:phosphatidate cytidylyltransferase